MDDDTPMLLCVLILLCDNNAGCIEGTRQSSNFLEILKEVFPF